MSILTSYFFFNNPPTPKLYTLSLHDALPIFHPPGYKASPIAHQNAAPLPFPAPELSVRRPSRRAENPHKPTRSEEHTSELQSHSDLVCRLLLEKKKKNMQTNITMHAKNNTVT